MTPLKFHTDAFFAHSLALAVFDRPVDLESSPLSLPLWKTDSFEKNRFNRQFLSQISQLHQKKSELSQQLLMLKNDEAGQKKRQELMAEQSSLEERHKLLSLMAEQLEKSSQVIAANFR